MREAIARLQAEVEALSAQRGELQTRLREVTEERMSFAAAQKNIHALELSLQKSN